MQAYLSVKNSGPMPSISVFCDDLPLFSGIIRGMTSSLAPCPAGSRAVSVRNDRGRELFSLWLSLAPEGRHLLEVSEKGCTLTASDYRKTRSTAS